MMGARGSYSEQGWNKVRPGICVCVCGVSLCVFAPACVWLGVTVWVCVGRSSPAWFWDLGERPI